MFEAYSIAIRLSLINGVTSGLLGLSRQFQAADKDAKSLQKSLDGIKAKMALGAVTTGGGLGILGGVYHLTNAAKEYGSQIALINQLGMSQKDVASAVGAAWKTAFDVPTTKIAENLKIYRELRSVYGPGAKGEAESRMMLPYVQRVSGVLYALTGKPQDHVGRDLNRVIELKAGGAVQPEFALRNMDLLSRTLMGMGGTLDARDLHGAFLQAKMAAPKWSEEFAFTLFPALLAEMKAGPIGGAQKAGTTMNALYRVVHGRMEKAAKPYWAALGLLDARGNVKDTELYERNPLAWVMKDMRPELVDATAKRLKVSQETIFDRMASNKNAGFALYTMYQKHAQFERDQKLIMQAKSSEQAYGNLLKTDPRLAGLALQSQYDNAKVVFGMQVLPELVKGMQVLMPLLRDFTKWAKDHGSAVKGIMVGAAAAGTLLTAAGGVIGTAALIEAGTTIFKFWKSMQAAREASVLAGDAVQASSKMSGLFSSLRLGVFGLFEAMGWWTLPIVAGLAAIGGGIYFIASKWDMHKGVFDNIKSGLSAYGTWLAKFGNDLLAKVRKWEDSPSSHKADVAKTSVGFLDGVWSGMVDSLTKWGKLAKGAWDKLSKWWDPAVNYITNGIADFLKRLDKLGKWAHALMPWAFKDDTAKPSGASGNVTVPLTPRNFGAYVGSNAVSSFLGTVLRVPIPAIPAPRQPLVPSAPAGGKQPIHTTVNLDGRPIAKVVSYYQEKDMDFAARSGSSQIDPRRSLTPAGLSFA